MSEWFTGVVEDLAAEAATASGYPTDPQQDRRSGKGVRVCANESRPAAGADLTSSLTIRHTEERLSAPVAHAGTDSTLSARYTRTGAATWSCGDCVRPQGAVITDRSIHDTWHTLQPPAGDPA